MLLTCLRIRPHHSVFDLTRLLNVIVRMKHSSSDHYLFVEMRQWGSVVNDYILNVAITSYCLLKRVDLDIAIMGFFSKSGLSDVMKLFENILDLKLCEPNDVMIQRIISCSP